MKLKHILVMAACGASLASCNDDQLIKNVPVVPGSEVSFSLGLDRNSRTYYAYPENAGGSGVGVADAESWKIFWTNGDRVNIVSPDLESAASPYKITVNGQGQDYANGITTINANGIQWGNTQPTEQTPVRFYSVFPESYKISFGELGEVVSNDLVKNGSAQSSTPVTANLHIRRNQLVLFTKTDTHLDSRIGLPVDRASNTEVEDCQNNPDAIMYAQTKQTTGGDVMLQYRPLSTVLNIKIEDITGGTNSDDPTADGTAIVYGFKLTAPVGTKLCGAFDATFDADCEAAPTISSEYQTGDNEITISTIDDISGHYLQVSTKDQRPVEFNVFLVPTAADKEPLNVNGWTLEIETDYGDYTTTLNSGDNGNGILASGQIHYMPLATVDLKQGNYELNPESWMSEIPSNVYFTELTLPGAWYATQSEYQGSGVTVESLYGAGVRAFSIETRSWCANGSTTPTGVCLSGTGSDSGKNGAYGDTNGVLGIGAITATRLSTTINSILEQVAKTPEEFAVMVISYAGEGDGGHRNEDYNYWFDGLKVELDNVTADKNLIYGSDGKQLTPHTTVGDVRGKLIIKINMDERFKDTTLPTTNFPVVLAYTSYKWVRDDNTDMPANQQNLPLMSHGRWITEWNASTDFANLTGTEWNWDNMGDQLMSHQDGLHFAYTNSNRVYHVDQGGSTTATPDIPTSVERQNSINTLVSVSKDIYQNGAHNVWFQIGACGVEAQGSTGDTETKGGEHVAVHFNQFFYYTIQEKIENNNPSPLGIVLCNFISTTATVTGTTNWWGGGNTGGHLPGGDYANTFDGTKLIDQILKMNNLFYLQRDPNWVDPNTPQTTNVKSASPNHSSGFTQSTSSSGTWESAI